MFARAALLSLGVAGALAEQTRYDGHSVLRVQAKTAEEFISALQYFNGEVVEHDVWREDANELTIDVRVEPEQRDVVLDEIESRGLKAETWIKDVQAMLDASEAKSKAFSGSADPFFDNYRSYDEVVAKTREIASNFPGATFVPSIGRSSQGKDIAAIRFGGSRPNGAPKAVYLQGGIHAREWISPATVMYIMNELTSSTDPEIRALVDEIEVIIAPVVNPDGYDYSRTNQRLWRKSRNQNSGSTCIGTDLNRNWDDHWGEGGSSSNPCSDTYRGRSPADQPETQAVVDYLMNTVRRETTLMAGVDFHAYGQLLLRPYGWCLPGRDCLPPNEPELKSLGDGMRDAILNDGGYRTRYSSEHSAELYIAAGGADDWFYSVASDYPGNPGIGLCLELRDTGRYGFTLPSDQIVPTGEETMVGMKVFLKHVADKRIN